MHVIGESDITSISLETTMKSEHMSEQKRVTKTLDIWYPDRDSAATNKPAIGVHVTPTTDPDTLVGTILRARQAGHDIIVFAAVPAADQIESFVRQLEVTALWFAQATNGDLIDHVISFARDAGYPGMLVQRDIERPVDFEASISELQAVTDYATDVAYEPILSSEPHVLVGIPAYNEEQAIAEVVTDALRYADDVLVVDDSSDDATVEQATDAGATVIEHEVNQGYGGALNTIFGEASRVRTDSLAILDADGQHNPDQIPDLLETQRETGADIVIGSRFTDGGNTDAPLYRRAGLGVVNLLTNLSLGVIRSDSRIKDTQSGFRLYSRSAIDSLAAAEDISNQMSASTDILYHAQHNNFVIEEVGADIKYDVEDASNINPISHGITLVMNIIRTIEQDRPVTILGIPGFASTLIGIGFGYWTFSNYIVSGTFPIGIAIMSVFFTLAGIFASFTAIILHSLNTHLDL